MEAKKETTREIAQKLGAAISEQRKSLKLTQEDLSRFSGCGLDFIYRLENGNPGVRLDKLIDILMVLGLQLTLQQGKQGVVIGLNGVKRNASR